LAQATPAPAAPVAAPPVHTTAPVHTAAPLEHAAAPSGDTRAAAVVRSYLGALARGDRETATSYLAHGTPTETFMSSGARIESIRTAAGGAAQYTVTADVQTSSGEYYTTFTVQQGPIGLQITDHYTIKPQ
jgi:hypothetical protein